MALIGACALLVGCAALQLHWADRRQITVSRSCCTAALRAIAASTVVGHVSAVLSVLSPRHELQ